MSQKLLAAAAKRPTPELLHLLDMVERRIGFHRSRTLALASVRGAIESELARRAATHGLLSSIGLEGHP
jgi:hypothetical protein